MTGFHEEVFPLTPDRGAGGGPGFHTTILTLASGFEQRNRDWVKSRSTYDVGTTIRSFEDLYVFQNFFYARQGRAFGFLYADPADDRAPFWTNTPGDIYPIEVLFTTDGSTATFQLTKLYGDTSFTYSRIIKKPKASTLVLYDTGSSPVVALTDPADYTYSTTTGIVTISNALKVTTGRIITGYFEFYTPVRFDIDDLKQVITDYGTGGVPTIPLIEVRL